MSDDLAIAPAAQPTEAEEPYGTLAEALEALPPRPRGAHGHLNRTDIAILVQAIHANWPTQRIAAALNMEPTQISRWRSKLRDSVLPAKQWLKGGALEAAISWRKAIPVASKRGDHRPAKELLQAVGAIDQDIHTGVQVNIGMGTGAMGSDPIDVSVSNNGSSVK